MIVVEDTIPFFLGDPISKELQLSGLNQNELQCACCCKQVPYKLTNMAFNSKGKKNNKI